MPYRKREASDGEQNQATLTRSHHTSLAVEIPIYLLVMTSPLAIGTVHLASVVVMWALSNVAFISLLIRSRRHKLPIKLFSLGIVLLGMSSANSAAIDSFAVRTVFNPTGKPGRTRRCATRHTT